jgi:hypothetical protein
MLDSTTTPQCTPHIYTTKLKCKKLEQGGRFKIGKCVVKFFIKMSFSIYFKSF